MQTRQRRRRPGMRFADLHQQAGTACAMQCCGDMNSTMLAALIEWPDGRTLVVTLGQLGDMPPRRLAGACIRLVSWCLCCGALLEPGHRAEGARP